MITKSSKRAHYWSTSWDRYIQSTIFFHLLS